MKDIAQYIKDKVPSFSEKEHIKIVQLELINLLFKGVLNIRAVKPLIATKISEKPAISKLASIQIVNNYSTVLYLSIPQKHYKKKLIIN